MRAQLTASGFDSAAHILVDADFANIEKRTNHGVRSYEVKTMNEVVEALKVARDLQRERDTLLRAMKEIYSLDAKADMLDVAEAVLLELGEELPAR